MQYEPTTYNLQPTTYNLQPTTYNPQRSRVGFTLIELSIVLVIIGLIVGGVVVGQDLIAAATASKQTSQVTELEAQINTFRLKYGCLPGDCANITDFFGTTDAQGHTVTNGDGDGLIRSTIGGGAPFDPNECVMGGIQGTELPQVFLQLNDAGIASYISDGSGNKMNVGWGPVQTINNGTGLLVTCLMAQTPTFNQFVTVDSDLQKNGNVIILGAYQNNNNPGNRVVYIVGWFPALNNSTPIGIPVSYAQKIDKKIDDGRPNTGKFGVIQDADNNCFPVSGKGSSPSPTNTYPISNNCNVTAGKIIN